MKQQESLLFITKDKRIYLGKECVSLCAMIETYLNRVLSKTELVEVCEKILLWSRDSKQYLTEIPTLTIYKEIVELRYEALQEQSAIKIQGEQPVLEFLKQTY